ncbi:MAG: nucleotide exchange factor GrpE [Candidatus Methanomethylophilaceae archaeon]|nr:nucleotide exchange factor GrpE [Candidatus Methanomethylophilaceae archaeon]
MAEAAEAEKTTCASSLEAKIDDLSSRIDAMSADISGRMMSYEVLAQFDKTLKGELTDVKKSSITSLLIKVANVRETADDMVARMESGKDAMTIDDAIDAVDSFGDMLEEILTVNGAVRFRDEAGCPYEYPRHNKAKVIDTDDPDLNKTVAKVVSSGYMMDGKVILPEKVLVYRYVKPAERSHRMQELVS